MCGWPGVKGSLQNMQSHLARQLAILAKYVLLVRVKKCFCVVGLVGFVIKLGLVGVVLTRVGWVGRVVFEIELGVNGFGVLLRYGVS